MEYRTSFIGIPLPEEYLEDFITLTEAVKTALPDIRIVDLATPHITVFFLGNQTRKTLEQIASEIEQNKETLGKITVGGGGTFGMVPRILFIKAEGKKLYNYYQNNLKMFSKYRPPERDEFTPHLTVGRLKGRGSKEYLLNKQMVQELLDKEWEFEIKEIAIYGVDSSREPNMQEKLITIKI